MRRCSFVGMFFLAVLLALTSAPAVMAQSATATATHGIQLDDMDLSVDPAQDFYQFANGGWLARTEIPADSAAFSVFNDLYLTTVARQLTQLGDLMQSNTLADGSDQWKAVRFFEQGIDMETRNAQGMEPVLPQLDTIASATDLEHLHELMASTEFAGIPDFFNVGVAADLADSTINTAWLSGPRLGLPDVTYYIEDSELTIATREAYKTAAAGFFQLIGFSETEAIQAAEAVYEFEATMAAEMVTPVERQNPASYYHPVTFDDMQLIYPELDWLAYMESAGASVDGSSIVIDSEERLLQNLATILAETDFQTIQDYLTLQTIMVAAPYLDQQARDVYFGFTQALYGLQQQKPLEQDVLASVNALMPDAMGQLYVAEYFPPEAKADIEMLVANLVDAFRIRLENNQWMSPETRDAAIEKLDAMGIKVGYPDKWQEYENYVIGDSYWATVVESLVAEHQRQMGEYGKPVDRSKWIMSAQTVNAGYDPSKNDMTFPAAILQPPFYDPEADPASNYGAIGFVIGHEITHAFDLQGSQFDKDGNFANWWTEADLAAFQELNELVVAEYGAIEAMPGIFVNGQLTVTENVADLGGLQAAFDALQLALDESGDPGEIDGFTQEQRFFIAAAQVWRMQIREAALQSQLQTDPHAPAFARATVPAENMDAFYEAFPEIQPGDPEYIAPENRVTIW